MNIETMIDQYIATALWASTDDNGQPYDQKYDISNITKSSRIQCKADCEEFIKRAGSLLDNWDASQAGHDFWLSRNGHGAGFFDRIEIADKEICNALQNIARDFGQADIVVHNKSFFWIT